MIGEEEVFLYPVNELIGAEISVASPELKAQRIDVLNRLSNQPRWNHGCSYCRDKENGHAPDRLETIPAYVKGRQGDQH